MKKTLTIVLTLLLCTCLVALCACDATMNEFVDNLQKITGTAESHNKVTVTIMVANSETTLTSSYVITQTDSSSLQIEYVCQHANQFTMQGGVLTPPEEKISTYTGTATIVNGVVSDPIGKMNINPVTLTSFKFGTDKANFANADSELNNDPDNFFNVITVYTVDVVNPQGFLGVEATDMKLEFKIDTLTKVSRTLSVTYTDKQGNAVKINYVFHID